MELPEQLKTDILWCCISLVLTGVVIGAVVVAIMSRCIKIPEKLSSAIRNGPKWLWVAICLMMGFIAFNQADSIVFRLQTQLGYVVNGLDYQFNMRYSDVLAVLFPLIPVLMGIPYESMGQEQTQE